MCTKTARNEMSPDILFLNLPTPRVVLSYKTDNDNDKTDNDESSEGLSAAVNSAADEKVDEGPLLLRS